ncbi:hypothetical protein L1887_32185 [Cichorium endivia]|nr:hypothetical protein L1887_32185 [Cichorium endivia]
MPLQALTIWLEESSLAAADKIRLLKRLERLRTKANHMLMDDEYTPFIASPSFKSLCKKAMSVCIINPLWRIVHLSAPELIKYLHEEKGYASLDVYWLKSLPKILHELQTVLDGLEDSRNWGILDRHMWDEVNRDEELQDLLKKIKGKLADYFPVLIDEAPRAIGAIKELKTVIDVMLILCSEFLDSDVEFVVLCLWKANEEGFSPIMYRYARVTSALSPVASAESETNPPYTWSSEHSTQHVNFVLCCPIELGKY